MQAHWQRKAHTQIIFRNLSKSVLAACKGSLLNTKVEYPFEVPKYFALIENTKHKDL